MFESTSALPNLTFGQFSVARKLIINGGAIRLRGLLFLFWQELLWDDIKHISTDRLG